MAIRKGINVEEKRYRTEKGKAYRHFGKESLSNKVSIEYKRVTDRAISKRSPYRIKKSNKFSLSLYIQLFVKVVNVFV